MARIRTIKPEFWEDETVGRLSRDARLLFIACFNMADDEGRLRWSPPYVRGSAFMYDDDLSANDVALLMRELTEAKLIRSYVVDKGQALAQVVNFKRHQVINRPSASQLPPPPDDAPDALFDADFLTFTESSVSTHGGLSGGKEGKGRERKGVGEEPRRSRATTLPASFEVTEALTSWALGKCPGIDLGYETEKFMNFHKSKGSTFKDWNAAWRTWITKAAEFRAKDSFGAGGRKEWYL